jgi:hypothetical protein
MIVEEQISIVEEQIAARQQRARKTIEAILTGPVGQAYGDYVVKSASGREYRVAMRGPSLFENFCSCADFAVNTLDTCKHIEALLLRLHHRFGRSLDRQQYQRTRASLSLQYGDTLNVRVRLPSQPSSDLQKIVSEYFDADGFLRTDNLQRFEEVLEKLRAVDQTAVVYSDVLDFIDHKNEVASGLEDERQYLAQLKKGKRPCHLGANLALLDAVLSRSSHKLAVLLLQQPLIPRLSRSPNAEPLWSITEATRRFRLTARHFITCTRRLSATPFHELVKGLEIRAFCGQQRTRPFAKLKAFQPLLWRRIGLCSSYLPCSVAPPLSLANVATAEGMSSSPPPYHVTRDHHFDPESRRHGPKVAPVECDQCVGAPIDRRFQHHLIARVSQLRPPQKVCFHRPRHRHHRIQEYFYLSFAQPCRQPALSFRANCFIFQSQRDADEQRYPALPRRA